MKPIASQYVSFYEKLKFCAQFIKVLLPRGLAQTQETKTPLIRS